MKRFILRLVIFAACLVAVDLLTGGVFPRLVDAAKGGDNWRNNYICNETSEDILIFGSSRAIHHYNPAIISDSTGLSCYNCGQDGNGIILNYGRLQMIEQRYVPKLIIYDITPSFDILTGDDNHKYLSWLRAYYDSPGIPEIFESVDKAEKYKMISNMYRYNSRFVQIVSDCVRPLQSSGLNGYRPLEGEMDMMKVRGNDSEDAEHISYQYDSLKLYYWDKLFRLASNTKLILVISPLWYGMSPEQYAPLQKACEEYGLVLINFADNPKYLQNPEYYKDGMHLNAKGADEFTRDLVLLLKNMDIL